MFRKLRGVFGGREDGPGEPSELSNPGHKERTGIGTEEDLLRGFDAAFERHERAAEAEQNGDPERAIQLYEQSVSENFVGSHPYETLAAIHERRHDYPAALRVTESYVRLAQSGRMPRGAQRSANRKLPEFEARAERYRRHL